MIKNYTAFYFRDYVYVKELDQVFQVNGLGDWIVLDNHPLVLEIVKEEFEQQGVSS